MKKVVDYPKPWQIFVRKNGRGQIVEVYEDEASAVDSGDSYEQVDNVVFYAKFTYDGHHAAAGNLYYFYLQEVGSDLLMRLTTKAVSYLFEAIDAGQIQVVGNTFCGYWTFRHYRGSTSLTPLKSEEYHELIED